MAHAQSQMYLDKAYKFIKKNTVLHKDIILTKDGIIFDGNHHWLALAAMAPDLQVPMYQVDMDFAPLKQITVQHYPNVTFEEHWVEWLDGYVQEMIILEGEEDELVVAY